MFVGSSTESLNSCHANFKREVRAVKQIVLSQIAFLHLYENVLRRGQAALDQQKHPETSRNKKFDRNLFLWTEHNQ